jgi:nucleotide-binding universal stress UspA family protein
MIASAVGGVPTAEDKIMYRSILVPLDGSRFGEHALPLALSLARRAGASLHLVEVHTAYLYAESGLVYDDQIDTMLREQERGYLEAVVKRLRAVSPVPISHILQDGAVSDTLAAQAAATGVDLIVMTTHGRGPLSRFWLGSIADELVRRAAVPVLLVRPEETAPELTHEPVLRHVIIALDGSALAEKVIEPAAALARLNQAEITLLRIVKPVLFPGHDPKVVVQPPPAQPATDQAQSEAHSNLEGIAERWRGQGMSVQIRVMVDERPAVAILELSQALPESVIALATHGRGGLTRAVLGSVADKVVRGATGPVLVCRGS